MIKDIFESMHPSAKKEKTAEEKEHDKRLRALKVSGFFDKYNPFRNKEKDIKNAQSTRVDTPTEKEKIFDNSKNPVERINVIDSTAIQDARYNEKTGNMSIRFRGGHKDYVYPDVSPEEVDGLKHANSKGRYFQSTIAPHSINA